MSHNHTRLAVWCATKLAQSILAGITAVVLAAKVVTDLPLVPLVATLAVVALAAQVWGVHRMWTNRATADQVSTNRTEAVR